MKWESGGGGMVTTMSDFAKFSRWCWTAENSRASNISAPNPFELMTSDHIGPGSGVARDYSIPR